MSFRTVPDRLNFPENEEKILAFWNEIQAFETSYQQSVDENRPEYLFYDGPPFATGLPHYGHILAGTIKDTVTRYAHQTGHRVSRRFGWDCHGLPVEYEIDQKLGIKSKSDVMKMGIAAYNKECRSIVQRYSSEWKSIVQRLGRWIDFDNDYKTLEPWYMESVWWVFKTVFEKKLVYQGHRVMPYSTKCTTPLSNFEANLNYKDVTDPAVVVTFPIVGEPDVALLAWTTTPWTLPSNLALCVHPEMQYCKIEDVATGKQYILLEARLCELYPKMNKKGYKGGEFKVIKTFPGVDLQGTKYEPLFPYFKDHPNAFQVLVDGYVTATGGTGVVHQSPGFGEDDNRVCLANGVIVKGGFIPCPVDANGCFEPSVTDFAGQYVKDADDKICAALKAAGRLLRKGTLTHSYPFCWRSDTPLIYRIIPSWFVAVEEIKEKLLANNAKTHWVPSFVKEKRFHNWLADARDWNISRNRYWGTPLPIWTSDDGEEIVVVGSIDELKQLSGRDDITDLHRESIDDIEIPSKQGKGTLKRVEEVFDCWFESGSMPYAQLHYPFENKERFENGFPADFIAEGLDQTRGWFYTLTVLATALFDKPPFKNLIVNGLILAEDGKKMSKSKKNYPDPMLVVDKFGADTLRLYLINSPSVRAEPFRFKESGVLAMSKDVFGPWFNAFRFFIQNAQRLELNMGKPFDREATKAAAASSTNVMDRWILASMASLIQFVRAEMAAYRLYTVVPALLKFQDELTNWYVRLNRARLKGSGGDEDAFKALSTMYVILLDMSKLMGPFTPYFAEYLYQELVQPEPTSRYGSVHYHLIPEFDESLMDKAIEAKMARLQTAIGLGRLCRERVNISLKKPVKEVIVVHKDQAVLDGLNELSAYLSSELNTKTITLSTDEKKWCSLKAMADGKALGPRLGKQVKVILKAVRNLTPEQCNEYLDNGSIEVEGVTLGAGDVRIIREFKGDSKKYNAATSAEGDMMLIIDTTEDDSIVQEGLVREVLNRIQKLRKAQGLQIQDKLEFFYDVLPSTAKNPFAQLEHGTKKDNTTPAQMAESIVNNGELLRGTLHADLLPIASQSPFAVVAGDVVELIKGVSVRLVLTRPAPSFPTVEAFKSSVGVETDQEANDLFVLVGAMKYETLVAAKDSPLVVRLNGKEYSLVVGKDLFLTGQAAK